MRMQEGDWGDERRASRNPGNWGTYPLYSLAEWINGLAFRNINFSPSGRPVIKINELKYGITPQTHYTNQEFDHDYLLSKGDLLFSWSGSPETSIDAFWYSLEDGWLNQHIFKVHPSPEVDRVFFFYLLKYLKPLFIEIARNKQTTGLGHVTVDDLKRMEVRIPNSLEEQRAIVRSLHRIDSKIGLDQHMNQTLESIGKAIFKHWFVEFEFPDESGKPYKSSGGKMVYSEELRQEIPEGWNAGNLSNVATQLTEQDSPFKKAGEIFPHFSIEAYDTGMIPIPQPGSEILSNKFRVREGTVLVSKLNPKIQRVWPIVTSPRNAVCSTEFLVFRPEHGAFSFFYYLMLSVQVHNKLVQMARGTSSSHQRVSAADIIGLSTVVPPRKVLGLFERAASLGLARREMNLASESTLRQIRECLLPKLMSGKIRVPVEVR